MPSIVRLTLFKLSNPEMVQKAIQSYATLQQDARRDGKPYILMATANPTHQDARNQGYNVVARTMFQSKDDMDYYDNSCEAHSAIKAWCML
ncbi:hypothetical protein ACEQ8H_008619 [Pleosporales sp. CAS-2024a]